MPIGSHPQEIIDSLAAEPARPRKSGHPHHPDGHEDAVDEEDVQTLLRSGDEETRIWLASRILESARNADVWRCLSLTELRVLFPHLKLKPPVREAWANALQVWE